MKKTDAYFVFGLLVLIAFEVFFILGDLEQGKGFHISLFGFGFIMIFVIVWIIELIERRR